MNEISNDKVADERAARIDAIANEIIEDAKKREAERDRHNAEEMEKLKRFLTSGSKSERGAKWNR